MIEEKESTDVLDSYRESVLYYANEHVDKLFMNKDWKRALMVLSAMFKTSKESLRIYAGDLCNQVTASPVYISSISDFIEAGGELKILLSDYSEKKALEVNPNLFRRLAYYISGNRNVQIRKCAPMTIYRMEDSGKKEIQFAVADGRAYRIEFDIKELRAAANFNDTEMAKTYTDIFDKQFIRGAEIDLLTPFKFHNVAAV